MPILYSQKRSIYTFVAPVAGDQAVAVGGKMRTAIVLATGLSVAFVVPVYLLRYNKRMRDRVINKVLEESMIAKTDEKLEGLPEPVRRYLECVLPAQFTSPKSCTARQSGEICLARNQGWMSFTADQVWSCTQPAFAWFARLRMNSLLYITGCDSYIQGQGTMTWKVMGLIKVAHMFDQPEINEGTLVRWLAEMALAFPGALLPSEHLRWEAVSGTAARVSLSSGKVTATLDFDFAPLTEVDPERGHTGEDVLVVSRITCPGRWRALPDGTMHKDPWRVTLSQYQRTSRGFLVPHHAEVSWLLEDGEFTCIKMDSEKIEYKD